MKTHFKEGGSNEELIDNMVQLLENIVVLVRRVAPQYSGWAFSGLLTDGGTKKVPRPRTCHTYPAMMRLGTDIPYLKEI